jgi:lipid II:glycine glycyltransferase (peptidoglycan interpeptide bridge formation enzyme)
MIIREIRPEEKDRFNQVVTHPLQSWQWGQFRQSTGVDVVRLGVFEDQKMTDGFQITFHKVLKFNFCVGYMPKSSLPNEQVLGALRDLSLQKNAIFIKFEPDFSFPQNESSKKFQTIEKEMFKLSCVRGRPLFTKYSFLLDLEKSEDELLKNMKQKTRYNMRLAQKKGVRVVEDSSDEAFEEYLKLTFETTKRQGFYAHDKAYHRKMWQALKPDGTAQLLKAVYQDEVLVTWIVFVFNNVLYYPYGASSSKHRNLMASNLMMWEAIKFGKKMNCHSFDMWGSLGPDPDSKDPWIGFHKFKQSYNPTLMEFVGSFDFVVDEPKYKLYQMADNLRWKWLRFRTKLPF